MSSPALVAIVGPTASGKSALAMKVAQMYGGEIICADSRTVYKGMDIGTAKPSVRERALVPHHLLDIVRPHEPFTAADFKAAATKAIAAIHSRGHVPVLVGGTGLYIDSVLFDFEFGEPADPQRRTELQQMTIEALQDICRQNNIEIPINDQNKRHLIRAIELGGLPKNNRDIRPYTLVVGISTDREVLRQRIEHRARAMLQAGITDEVRGLANEYGWEPEAMTGNIYRIFRGVIEGVKSEQEALQEVVTSDMQLAKRQMTWFRRNPHIVWGEPDELLERVGRFLHSS
ncbi:MAG TPA: tRNA (adenosine(37)-N6)-dimethylallyltransferase MiaA [Candidatus Saccharimonadales bacterium]|nr:tRNA (adenosine(37)-N6)-dimethylallyltransferase MiaA [Candidatus Saccharimonadales bacterium]